MTSTVRIEEADKDRLKRLQQAWKRLKGEAPSQKELVGKVLAYAEAHEEEFLADAAWRPPTEAERAYWRRRIASLGGWEGPDATQVDEVVYGGEAYEEMMGRRERE